LTSTTELLFKPYLWLHGHGLQHAFDRVRHAYQHPKTQANAMVHKASEPLLSVLAWWDTEARVWVATSDDVQPKFPISADF
jgi:hypothetical protein